MRFLIEVEDEMANSLGELFSIADNLYQTLLRSKEAGKGWSVAVPAMVYTPANPPVTNDENWGWLTYSPFRVDVSQIRDGNLPPIPYLEVIPASFAGQVQEASVQLPADPMSFERDIEYIPGTLTVTAPTFSGLASGAFSATWNGEDKQVTGKILPADSQGSLTTLTVKPESTDRTVVFLGDPTELPLNKLPPPHIN
jgi:hypothetical protein